MSLQPQSEVRGVTGISGDEEKRIKAFLQGAVYTWINVRGDQEFAARDLVGGENRNWNGTPLQVLFEKHKKQGKDDTAAFDAAAQDAGWLLKAVLDKDQRDFAAGKSGLVSAYRWIR